MSSHCCPVAVTCSDYVDTADATLLGGVTLTGAKAARSQPMGTCQVSGKLLFWVSHVGAVLSWWMSPVVMIPGHGAYLGAR